MKHEKKLRNKLGRFLADQHVRNQWITTPEVAVYVRKAYRRFGGVLYPTLDLANITVPHVLWGKGIASGVITIFQAMSEGRAVYVENIKNSRLEIHLRKLQAADPRWLECTYQNSGITGCWIWIEDCNQLQASIEGLAKERP